MPAKPNRLVVFVHGWSVTNTDTYGGLPKRLAAEASRRGMKITVEEVHLGEYVSFQDEVQLEDVARGFQAAYERKLARLVREHGPFICVTHSTGGPVMRLWLDTYVFGATAPDPSPLSHLIMLAPANFGSALAQLGKSRIGRLKSWLGGVEPGVGVLNWLELGSPGSWELNLGWLRSGADKIGPGKHYPFSITGQSIDREFYDNLNSYTGENGSDGVVRSAAANLNATYVRLEQGTGQKGPTNRLTRKGEPLFAPRTAFCIVPGKSHSGKTMGIMRSVRSSVRHAEDMTTLEPMLQAMAVETMADYTRVCAAFDRITARTQKKELIERERKILKDRYFVHDRCSMVVFRLRDDSGHVIGDYDLTFTAGDENDPNAFPQGFSIDRQRNRLDRGTLTYYFDHDIVVGSPAVTRRGKVLRPASPGAKSFGVQVIPRPDEGFVQYRGCVLRSKAETLEALFEPNQTTLVDIVLRRAVGEGVFKLLKGIHRDHSFKNVRPGNPIP